MKESVLKAFWRDTYQSRSPIPFIISVQVLLFVVIHLFELFQEIGLVQFSLYDYCVSQFSLPLSFNDFLKQPWSILTYSFLYTGLFQLVFDCLWLFWMGNNFLNFLNRRQFLFLYISTTLAGAAIFIALGTLPMFQNSAQSSFHNASFALAALVAAIATLVPRSEVRLLLFGNINLKTIAIVFITLSILFVGIVNKAAAVTVLVSALWGLLFTRALQQGNDFSLFFKFKKRSKLKVVHKSKAVSTAYAYKHQSDLPNQDEIDEILDKISVGGYESLTSQEKEVLFKASKGEK